MVELLMIYEFFSGRVFGRGGGNKPSFLGIGWPN